MPQYSAQCHHVGASNERGKWRTRIVGTIAILLGLAQIVIGALIVMGTFIAGIHGGYGGYGDYNPHLIAHPEVWIPIPAGLLYFVGGMAILGRANFGKVFTFLAGSATSGLFIHDVMRPSYNPATTSMILFGIALLHAAIACAVFALPSYRNSRNPYVQGYPVDNAGYRAR